MASISMDIYTIYFNFCFFPEFSLYEMKALAQYILLSAFQMCCIDLDLSVCLFLKTLVRYLFVYLNKSKLLSYSATLFLRVFWLIVHFQATPGSIYIYICIYKLIN